MASRQAIKEENAEAAARVAVDELSEANKERTHGGEESWPQNDPRYQSYPQQAAAEGKSPGVLGSILKSMGDKYEHLKGTVITSPKTYDTSDQTSTAAKAAAHEESNSSSVLKKAEDTYKNVPSTQTEDVVGMPKAGDYMSSASEKAGEYKDYAMDKTKEAVDAAMAKAAEYTDYTIEKGKEEKEAVGGRMADLREKAVAAAMKARDYFTGKPRDLDPKALEAGDITEDKYGETEFKASQKMQELKFKEEGMMDEAKQRAMADWETAADRGIAAKKNIYGAGGTLKDAIKDKLTYPTDIVQEARAAREYGGPKRGRGDQMVENIPGPTGPTSQPTAKASD